MSDSPVRATRPARNGAVAASAVGLLAARNLAERWLPAHAYVPVNGLLAAVLIGLARRSGSSWDDLGLDRRRSRVALRVGGPVAAAAAGIMALGAAIPRTRMLFDDERVDVDQGGGELLYQTLVRIPVGTAAFEELAFRGVLLALFRRHLSTPSAVAISSALFGLWHIVPSSTTASTNGITGAPAAGLVAGSVALTAVGGVAFCVLRLRGGHLLAPALVHVAINDTGFLLAWWTRT